MANKMPVSSTKLGQQAPEVDAAHQQANRASIRQDNLGWLAHRLVAETTNATNKIKVQLHMTVGPVPTRSGDGLKLRAAHA